MDLIIMQSFVMIKYSLFYSIYNINYLIFYMVYVKSNMKFNIVLFILKNFVGIVVLFLKEVRIKCQ